MNGMQRSRRALARILMLGAVAGCRDAAWNPLAPGAARLSVSATAPAAPAGLVATPAGPWQIDLAWTDASTTESSFQVYRRIRLADGTFTAWAAAGVAAADSTTFHSTGLAPNTRYQHQVRACAAVCSAWAVGNIATTEDGPPTPPTNLVATAVSSSLVRLEWTDASTTEAGFQLHRRTRLADSSYTAWEPVAAPAANVVAYDDSARAPGTTYQYQVAACDPARCSPPAVSQTVATPLAPRAPPRDFAATPISWKRVRLTWTDRTDGATYFRIYRRTVNNDGTFTGWTQTSPSPYGPGWDDDRLEAKTRYQYQIQMCDAHGCGPWKVGSYVATFPMPPSPSPVVATAVSPALVTVSWSRGSGDETGYVLERGVDRHNVDKRIILAPSSTGYADSTVIPGMRYVYAIAPCISVDCADYAISNNVTIPGAPPWPVTYFGGRPASDTQVDLSWTDRSDNETSFELQRRIRLSDYTFTPWVPIATLGADVTRYSDTGLVTGTYEYQIRTCNEWGCSYWQSSLLVTLYPPPVAPAGLVATPRAPSQVDLAWVDASNNERGFEVHRRLRNGDGSFGEWGYAGQAFSNATTWSDQSTVILGHVVQYGVRSCIFRVCSAFAVSAVVEFYRPAAPAALTASRVSATQIDLGWTDGSSNETSFQVYRRIRNADGTYTSFVLAGTRDANVTSFSSTGLATGTPYQYQVRACNVLGCSGWSVSGFVTP